MLKRAQKTGGISNTVEKLDDYGLGGIDCPECGNKGYIVWKDEDGVTLHQRECKCMNVRRSMRNIRTSGLADMLTRYTFDSYQAVDEATARAKQTAERFAEADEGWLYIAGRSGCGKTHLCTAICKVLIEKGKRVHYSIWRDDATELKSLITDSEAYQEKIRKLKEVNVLYIDDFFKVRNGAKVTDAEVNLAFEIINYRYNDIKKRTIISSEHPLPEILDMDEALGGRIYERCKSFNIKAPSQNWRLR